MHIINTWSQVFSKLISRLSKLKNNVALHYLLSFFFFPPFCSHGHKIPTVLLGTNWSFVRLACSNHKTTDRRNSRLRLPHVLRRQYEFHACLLSTCSSRTSAAGEAEVIPIPWHLLHLFFIPHSCLLTSSEDFSILLGHSTIDDDCMCMFFLLVVVVVSFF